MNQIPIYLLTDLTFPYFQGFAESRFASLAACA